MDTHLKLADEKYPYAENGCYDFEYKDQVNTLREAFIAGMQEREKEAIAFAEWISDNQFTRWNNIWKSTKIHYSPDPYTTQQLYKLKQDK